MDIKEILKDFIDTLYSRISPSFSAIYYGEKPLVTKTIISDRKKVLEETLGLVIYKGHQINEIIPNFEEEYIYTEGEGIQIYIHFVTKDISIVSIVETKIKFSLLKLEHEIVAGKLKEYTEEIENLVNGKKEEKQDKRDKTESTTSSEEAAQEVEKRKTEKPEAEKVEEEKGKERSLDDKQKTVIKEEETAEKYIEEIQENIPEDIEELEKVLSDQVESEEVKESVVKTDGKIEELEVEEELKEEELPSLEEILLDNYEEEEKITLEEVDEKGKKDYLDASVLDKIYKNLAREMGPVAKIIFNQKVKDLNINKEKLTKSKVKKLINELAKEILVEQRKERFIKNCNNLL
ncbi:hypothetical protein [Persephonella sp.]